MARTLDVYLDTTHVGYLVQEDGGQMTFSYASAWREAEGAFPLSISLPLREEKFTQRECQPFFGGTLPESSNRPVVARVLGISANNDFAMLEKIGGECAGAVTFVPAGEALPESAPDYRKLSQPALGEILALLPRRPLLAGEQGVRLSLAGAQEKLAVHADEDGQLSIPLGYAPSTHILKPELATWEDLVANELFCMSLAAAMGLDAAFTSAHRCGDVPYLLSRRFDRPTDATGTIRRLHQEDFCQALVSRSTNSQCLRSAVAAGPGAVRSRIGNAATNGNAAGRPLPISRRARPARPLLRVAPARRVPDTPSRARLDQAPRRLAQTLRISGTGH